MIPIEKNVSLKPYNTFGITCTADKFVAVTNSEELLNALQARAIFTYEPLLILGGGSNVLFRSNFPGMVLRNCMRGMRVTDEDSSHVLIESGAGERWDDLVAFAVERGWAGLENLSLIPGCVGASPMQNIGAYGAEIKDVCEKVSALEIANGTMHEFSAADCRFGYRDSIFKQEAKNRFVITSVSFRLQKQARINASYGNLEKELEKMKVTQPTISDIRKAVISVRQSKLPNPAVLGNAGSFFKNPVVSEELAEAIKKNDANAPVYDAGPGMKKLAAGWLIEKCGLKGYRQGDAGVHNMQALVLVNYGQASGNDIYNLSEYILQRVFEKFGVSLEREVNIIG
jgi:UDP-N-acetylmuramate dehydrogenase